MWQTALIVLLVVGVLLYIIRYYVKISRSGISVCSGCTGCSGSHPSEKQEGSSCDDSNEGAHHSKAPGNK